MNSYHSKPAVGATTRLGGDSTAGSSVVTPSLSGTIYVIINPKAGGGRGRRMWSAIHAELPSSGATFHEIIAVEPGQAWRAAETAAREGAGAVIAIGGDGTLNEALNGLMSVAEPQRPAIAFVPGGTANVLARALGLPRTPHRIGRILQGGTERRIDLGRANGRYFASIAAVGFDADVVAGAIPLRRWVTSKPAHVAAILGTLVTYRAATVRIRLDHEEQVVPLTFLAAANTEWYGGGLHLAPGARADDGRFLVVYGVALTRLDTVAVLLGAFSGRHLRHPKVTHRPASIVQVDADRPLAVHADGEWLGRWPSVTLEIIPAALRVIVPGDRAPGGERSS